MLKKTLRETLNIFKESCLETLAIFSNNQEFRYGVQKITRPAIRFIWLELVGIVVILGFLLFFMCARP